VWLVGAEMGACVAGVLRALLSLSANGAGIEAVMRGGTVTVFGVVLRLDTVQVAGFALPPAKSMAEKQHIVEHFLQNVPFSLENGAEFLSNCYAFLIVAKESGLVLLEINPHEAFQGLVPLVMLEYFGFHWHVFLHKSVKYHVARGQTYLQVK